MKEYIDCSKKVIRTKVNKQFYSSLCGIFLGELILIFFLTRSVYWVIAGQKELTFSLCVFWFIMCIFICVAIIVAKDFKYIIINQEQKIIKYYSIFAPFGKTLYLENYSSRIITSETGSMGSYEVIYLVNNNNYTEFKISGLFYSNFKEINEAIKLPRITCYKMNIGKYFKLLFTGKMKVEKSGNKSGDEKKTDMRNE